MSNEGNLNNCSEDLFQCCSESNEVKLRRSQRILERGLKTPMCSENIIEEFSSQYYSQLLMPPNQASKHKLKIPNHESRDQVEETQINNGDGIPDFTHILNTETADLDSKQLKESPKSYVANGITHEKNKGNSMNLSEVPIKDTQSIEGNRYRRWKPSTKTISIKSQELKTPPKKPLWNEVSDASNSETTVVQYENDVRNKISSKSLPTKNTSQSVNNRDQGIPSLNTNYTNNQSKNPLKNHLNITTTEKDSSLGVSQKIILPLKVEEIKSQLSSMEKIHLPVYDNEALKPNGLKRSRKISSNQITQKLPSQKKRRQSKKSTSYSRKRRQRSSANSISKKRPGRKELKPNCSVLNTEQSIIKDYVAPKVIRYNNTCPMAQTSKVFQCNFPISERSLLPAVYPAHFTQQILPEPPVTCLTPENSQVLTQPTVAIVDTSSTPLSVGSLQEFFEIDDLFDILNTEKTIYNLTELHVRALAISLNLNVDNLFTLMDRIVEMDINFLREKCEMREPVVSAWLIESNQMERNQQIMKG